MKGSDQQRQRREWNAHGVSFLCKAAPPMSRADCRKVKLGFNPTLSHLNRDSDDALALALAHMPHGVAERPNSTIQDDKNLCVWTTNYYREYPVKQSPRVDFLGAHRHWQRLFG